jgi:hypothetical protein
MTRCRLYASRQRLSQGKRRRCHPHRLVCVWKRHGDQRWRSAVDEENQRWVIGEEKFDER